MRAITKFLAGGVAIAALAGAAPAAAQYYPGYGYPGYGYPGYGGGIDQVISQVFGGGYGGYGGYGAYGGYNVPGGSQVAANQCSAAVQQRLGGYGAYGYAGVNRGIGIQSVEIRSNGGYKVRGVASGVQFTCRTDPRGFVTDVDVNNGYYGQGYGNPYYGSGYNNPYNPYAVYGYQRY
ncbi:MAG: hypothetical protein ACM3IG_08390 [Myxococcales bacterium]